MNEAHQIMGAMVFPLGVPIKAHAETVTELSLRRPTVAEIRKIGRMPYLPIDRDGKVTPDMSVVPDYIAVCAGIPPSSVDQLDLCDLNQLGWVVSHFFLTPASSASSS